MTNHIDPKQIAKAKEWAETVELYSYMYSHAELIIARIVANLPDQVIDAEKVREVIADWGNREVTSDAYTLYRQVLALLPTPEVAPKVLVTEEDYREAPDGTICAGGMGLPFHTSTRAWRSTSGIRHDHRDLSGTPRRVLRWGMGEQV